MNQFEQIIKAEPVDYDDEQPQFVSNLIEPPPRSFLELNFDSEINYLKNVTDNLLNTNYMEDEECQEFLNEMTIKPATKPLPNTRVIDVENVFKKMNESSRAILVKADQSQPKQPKRVPSS